MNQMFCGTAPLTNWTEALYSVHCACYKKYSLPAQQATQQVGYAQSKSTGAAQIAARLTISFPCYYYFFQVIIFFWAPITTFLGALNIEGEYNSGWQMAAC